MLGRTNAYMRQHVRSNEPLTDEQIREAAPSIFAGSAHESRSERYTLIPTIDVLNGLRKEGFQPFMVMQTKVRAEGKREHAKHMIRMRHADQTEQGEWNEIVLVNSHDGTSSYQMFGGVLSLGPKSLVQLPGSLLSALAFPDFSMITSPISIKYIVMFALVGSVESLLSVLAVDSMDPAKRASNLDKDLLAVGVGNLVASAIGGLPMISEIVRSKANMDAGATNKLSNFFHGLFLLLFVALMPGLLQMIPTAALAAMLLFTGYRLASPKEFIHMWHVGKDQFALFFVTFAVTLATDLLIGVGVGIALKLVMHMVRSHSFAAVFTNKPVVRREGSVMHVKFVGPAVFPSLLRVRKLLNPVPAGLTEVVVDLSECSVVDFTFQEKLFMIADEWEQTKLTITGADAMKASSSHPYASRVRAA